MKILKTFEDLGVRYIRQKLDAADYQLRARPEIVVDRKQNLIEVASNLVQEHDRFKRELLRAQEAGTHIVVLIEHSTRIKSIEDVARWENPRLRYSPMAITGERMAKVMRTMSDKYGVEWAFCDKDHTGKKILEILGWQTEGG